MTETITRINGNGQSYETGLPKLIIIGQWNDVALRHVFDNTGLNFTPNGWNGYEAQPVNSNQIVTLIMTYNFKTRYYNNASTSNTLFLKGDHHVGYDVDSICYDCCIENNISIHGLHPGDRLAC